MRAFKFHILLFLFSSQLFSQLGPGYLGKRFVAGYGFYFSPAILGSNGSEASIIGRGNAIGGDMAFNSMHEGFLEFAFKNRTSVGLSCKYYNTTFDNNAVAEFIDYSQQGYVYSYYGRPSGFYEIKGLTYTLYFKFYHKRYVAPWGRYIILGPTVNTYKCFYNPASMNYKEGSTNAVVVDNFGPQGQQFVRADVLFGWGRNRIVGNRITIDYGLNFEVLALGFILWDTVGESPLDDFGGTETNNLNYFEKTSKRRVREVNRFNIFLKIGVLLF